jgi:plastin-1
MQILSLLWQLLHFHLTANIDLESVPSIGLLLEPPEKLSDLLEMSPEIILLRWIKFHLNAAKSKFSVSSFGKGMKVKCRN